MLPFDNLEYLGMLSSCSAHVLVLLLQQCHQLKKLFIGTQTDIGDTVLKKVWHHADCWVSNSRKYISVLELGSYDQNFLIAMLIRGTFY